MSKSIIINEQQVLTCIFNKPDLLESLEQNWFVNSTSQCIFEALKKLYLLNVSFTTSTIVSECAKTNTDITHTLIDELKSKVSYDVKDFGYYKKRLIEDYVKEDLQGRVLKAATGALISKGELNIDLLKQTVNDIENAIDLVQQKNTKLLSFSDMLDEYEDALLNKSTSNFTSSGNRFIDQHLYGGGLEYGQICSIFGNSGNGKSIATLNLVNGKINRQDPTLYIPTEMGRFSTLDRLVAMRTGLTIDQLTHVDKETDSIPEYVLEEFRQEKKRLLKLKYFKLVDDSNISKPILQKLIQDMKKELKIDRLTVYIDLG
jgi:replicative DNA helicase